MRYKLVAVDLDGTLLGPDGKVSAVDERAITLLAMRGIAVVFCTGRSFTEAKAVISALPHSGFCVLVDGAHVFDHGRMTTLTATPVKREEVNAFSDCLKTSSYPVFVLLERPTSSADYFVIGKDRLSPVVARHFETLGVSMTSELLGLGHCLRVGTIIPTLTVERVVQIITTRMGPEVARRLAVQTFPAGEGTFKTIELLPTGVNKWNSLESVALGFGAAPAEIAAIGDSRNDIELVGAVGCGIAMGNACYEVSCVAKRHTRTNSEGGVAYAVDNLLKGIW